MNRPHATRVAALEAGGTKFTCAIGSSPEDIIISPDFPTGHQPSLVLSQCFHWLREQSELNGPPQALGIASFGPVDLHRASPTYGHITSTPKPGWQNVDLLGAFRTEFPNLPIGFDTDVNGAALGEFFWGSAQNLSDFLYITIGTGIGGGGMAAGNLLHGNVHPEMGHLLLPRFPNDTFPGSCPFHHDCWEGLCSGPAIRARTGTPAEHLEPNLPAWPLCAHYTGVALANLTLTLSPQKIILGGSVPQAGKWGTQNFFSTVRASLQKRLNNYILSPTLQSHIDHYIVPPTLNYPGLHGALALAQLALSKDA